MTVLSGVWHKKREAFRKVNNDCDEHMSASNAQINRILKKFNNHIS